ncbi:MBL fold metallo-hydrolase [Phenylobacterium sp.]|jgi:glyoxylase-like metal-dependent hydrolase (beta-lactamase superfamily II)|uniref:MBL fold metallo-hydrolase n=1 Tax=Phenylobacterium sp. TaxID=1871053 RepID=UPI002E32B565|nr:MBL fold metallo-hydrolase [Phenylobacterium sp.]HEX2559638.1 MBL fold metallo-hydrolase [Phenylobacterium sp.]
MKQLYPDLWQTRMEQPLPNVPDLKTRAYLITRPDGNLLIYSTGHADEHAAIGELGGLRRQYLSHVDEAGPALAQIREGFGSELWGHTAEAEAVRRRAGVAPDRTFEAAETHFDALEVLPLPGHTAGSTAYLYRSPHGRRYLFTGDTIGRDDSGVWTGGLLPFSDKAQLVATLQRMADLAPDVVLSSAWGGEHPVAEVTPQSWRAAVEEALAPLMTATA